MKKSIKNIGHLFKEAFNIFKEHHPVKFASAIAYFSLFAVPSIFLIIVFFLGLIFSEVEILRELKDQLSKVVGNDGAEILVEITRNYKEKAGESIFSVMIYAVISFWLSTQLFRLFQNSLNDLWDVKPDFKSYWNKLWIQRIMPFSLVILTGLMFFGSLVIETGLSLVLNQFLGLDIKPDVLKIVINILTAISVFFWFSFMYKVLPSVKIKWEPTFKGAAVTSLLFYLGLWLIWEFVIERDLKEIYGVVAPIIVVALWVFYSSLVFLYGASFTKAIAIMDDKQIAPASHAFKFKTEKDENFTDD